MGKKLTKYSQLKHGMRVKFKYDEWEGEGRIGKLSVSSDGSVFINVESSDERNEDYLCLALKNENIGNWRMGIHDLQEYKKTIEDVETGDILVDSGGDNPGIVLARINDLIALTYDGGFDNWFLIKALKENGWKLKDDSTEEDRETLEFEGKIYYRDEFEKRLEALEEVE